MAYSSSTSDGVESVWPQVSSAMVLRLRKRTRNCAATHAVYEGAKLVAFRGAFVQTCTKV